MNYSLAFVLGFGIMGTFTCFIFIGLWIIDKIYNAYLDWKNPWRYLNY